MRNSLNPWKYWKNQVFRTGHTGCSGRRNNSANWYTGCWHGLSTGAAVLLPSHHFDNSSYEDEFQDLFPGRGDIPYPG